MGGGGKAGKDLAGCTARIACPQARASRRHDAVAQSRFSAARMPCCYFQPARRRQGKERGAMHTLLHVGCAFPRRHGRRESRRTTVAPREEIVGSYVSYGERLLPASMTNQQSKCEMRTKHGIHAPQRCGPHRTRTHAHAHAHARTRTPPRSHERLVLPSIP